MLILVLIKTFWTKNIFFLSYHETLKYLNTLTYFKYKFTFSQKNETNFLVALPPPLLLHLPLWKISFPCLGQI